MKYPPLMPYPLILTKNCGTQLLILLKFMRTKGLYSDSRMELRLRRFYNTNLKEMDIKVYVEVNAAFNEDGLMISRSLVWEDNTTYHIDKVIYSLKGQQTFPETLPLVGLLNERLYKTTTLWIKP